MCTPSFISPSIARLNPSRHIRHIPFSFEISLSSHLKPSFWQHFWFSWLFQTFKSFRLPWLLFFLLIPYFSWCYFLANVWFMCSLFASWHYYFRGKLSSFSWTYVLGSCILIHLLLWLAWILLAIYAFSNSSAFQPDFCNSCRWDSKQNSSWCSFVPPSKSTLFLQASPLHHHW